ncbi:putative reverse transcriptase domain-containing protein [Tanacetum coccineum]|uniref:Reverse transcriptase domain-containing protein n=1 Tax=Tanacetum coccineum TaxID=301880 RepID=A0ABQ4YA80_9ASTR
MGMRGPVEVRVDRVTHLVVADDIPEPAQEGAIEVTYETLGDLGSGHRIVATGQQSADMLERIRELERDNRRLRDIVDVESQRVTQFRRSLRLVPGGIWVTILRLFHDYPSIDSTMPNIRFGASRIREGVNEQSDRRMAETLRVCDAVRNLGPLMGNEGEQNEGNRNGGNGNGGNRNEKYQVKYASCTLLNSALTWWNSHKRTVGIEAAYAMSWAELMKLMTEVYCPRNEVQKMETEMVPTEEDKVKRFVGGLPDNIQGNVIIVEPTKLQDTIRVTNNLMDQKLKGYARSVENKRRLDNNTRDNHGQQLIFKRQNVGGQNVARSYMAGNNEKKWFVGSLPYYSKCKIHHAGPCTVRFGNCKRVGQITRDYTTTVTPNTQRAPVGNQLSIICYECGRSGHFRKDYPKLRNQNRGNKTGNKNGNKTGNQAGSNEATAKAYAIGRGVTNPDSNVVTGIFLLNNCHASMLFDVGIFNHESIHSIITDTSSTNLWASSINIMASSTNL